MAERAPLAYGTPIGIIGGGQLGRLLAIAAGHLGYPVIVLDPSTDAPAFDMARERIVADYDDPAALAELQSRCGVVTYEFENVPVAPLAALNPEKLAPNIRSLEVAQDRAVEKRFLADLGIRTAPFRVVDTEQDLIDAVRDIGPGILKTRRMGYDGKGQVRITSDDGAMLAEAFDAVKGVPSIYEGFVAFEREISVIIARGRDGATRAFDIGENVHRDGILHVTTVPAAIGQRTQSLAVGASERLAHALDYVGVMGVEFFVLADGSVIANEFAPRVHNSGHWTDAACLVSQFEQHIRAICGVPLGDPGRHSDAVMTNLIGDDIHDVPRWMASPRTHLCLYGKREARAGRKMGHVTRLAPMTGQ